MGRLPIGPPPSVTPTASAVVSALMATLGKDTCFVYGALVLEDPGRRVFNLLHAHSYKRHTYAILPTHDAFVRGRALTPRLTVSSAGAQWEAALDPPVLMCRNLCDADEACADETGNPKRITLFYWFEITDLRDGTKMQYTYIKPENWPYYSIHHMVDAVKRYKLNIENMGYIFPTRREDEYYAQKQADTRRGDAHIYYDENIRVGNEVFLSCDEYTSALDAIIAANNNTL